MQLSGLISKMHTSLSVGTAQYQLPIGDKLLNINDLIGETIQLEFNGQINCANCGKVTNKSYSQGYCYPCCQKLASCDLCIMKPENCHHHLGTCREPAWGLDNCFTPHVIYLANSSGVKVGITRKSNIPSRWVDQGAVSALPILEVDTRLKSGQIEVALKDFVNDKTNWRKMLKNDNADENLLEWRDQLKQYIPDEAKAYFIANNKETKLNFPVVKYPEKPKSLNLKKTLHYTGTLVGIKGQYLIFEDETVFNVRANEGLVVSIKV